MWIQKRDFKSSNQTPREKRKGRMQMSVAFRKSVGNILTSNQSKSCRNLAILYKRISYLWKSIWSPTVCTCRSCVMTLNAWMPNMTTHLGIHYVYFYMLIRQEYDHLPSVLAALGWVVPPPPPSPHNCGHSNSTKLAPWNVRFRFRFRFKLYNIQIQHIRSCTRINPYFEMSQSHNESNDSSPFRLTFTFTLNSNNKIQIQIRILTLSPPRPAVSVRYA
jgi:hypothetical protein